MTDEEKIAYLNTAALYQQQLDTATRLRDEVKASMETYNQAVLSKTKQLDDIWKRLRLQVGSGS